MIWLTNRYRKAVRMAIEARYVTVGVVAVCMAGAFWVASGIGSEFLPHLDEGALWVRGTLAPSTGPTEGIRVADQVRILLARFPRSSRPPVKWVGRTTAPTPQASLTLNISLT